MASKISVTRNGTELWRRLLTSLGLLATLALAAIWGSRSLIHDDLFFRLSTGELVVEEHRIPTTDPFSFTRSGERWISHEWGFGLLAYGAYALGDYQGLVTFKVLLTIAITAGLVWLMLRMAGQDRWQFGVYLSPLLLIGLWAIQGQLVLRPSLVSSLLLVVLLHLLLSFDRNGSWGFFGGIIVLFFLWGNLHSEVLFGLFILGLVAAEAFLGRLPGLSKWSWSSLLRASPERPYLRLFALSVLATLINPNGIEVLLYPFRVVRFLSLGGMDLEMGHFTGATPESEPAFYLLLVLLLLALLPVREQLRRVTLTQAVSVGVFLCLALGSHRFIFYFTLLALPTMVWLCQPTLTRLDHWRHSPLVRNLLRVAVLLVAVGALLAAGSSHPRTPVSRHFPQGTVRFVEEESVDGRMFNHQNFGGYLHWRLKRPIFWDGRALLFEPLMRQLPSTPLEVAAEEWQLDYLVITEHEFKDLAAQLDPERWGLVFWDDFAALYLGRLDRFEPILARRELELLPPFGGVSGLNLLAGDDELSAAARRELDQVLELEPRSQRALYLQGLVSYYREEYSRAEGELLAAAALAPSPYIYRALADVMEATGRAAEAAGWRHQAIDLDPGPGLDEE